MKSKARSKDRKEKLRSTRRRDWIDRQEKATCCNSFKPTRKAIQAFRCALSREEQLSLTREIVETRSAELCLAYDNVVHIFPGYRVCQAHRTGRRQVRRELCICFVVKWKRSEKKLSNDQILPEYLFSYWTIKGVRTLCAVPVDVDSSSDYTKIRPHESHGRIVVRGEPPTFPEKGAITCALTRSAVPEVIYALSCRHVFGLAKQIHPRVALSANVHLDSSQTGPVIGETRSFMGKLGDDPIVSFDAQLAVVNDLEILKKALNGMSLSAAKPFASSQAEIPPIVWVRTPRGVVRAEARGADYQLRIPYGRPGINYVHHLILLQYVVPPGELIGGDSGSPVLSQSDGEMLIGMHIAGGGSLGYAIPAWQLFDPTNFDGIGSSETLAPKNIV